MSTLSPIKINTAQMAPMYCNCSKTEIQFRARVRHGYWQNSTDIVTCLLSPNFMQFFQRRRRA